MAPAPTRSSRAGRRRPSTRPQRSPAAMTAIGSCIPLRALATEGAFRRQAVTTVAVVATSAERVDPFGDGKTRRVPIGIDSSDAGDSDQPELPRGPAATASCRSVYPSRPSGRPPNGKTIAPRLTATSTAVENERTSMITTVLASLRTRRPSRPHANRTSNPCCWRAPRGWVATTEVSHAWRHPETKPKSEVLTGVPRGS